MIGLLSIKMPAMGVWPASALACHLSLLAFQPAFAQANPSPYTSGNRYDLAGQLVGRIDPDPDGVGPLGYPAVRNAYGPTGLITRREVGTLSAWQGNDVQPLNWSGFSVSQAVDINYDSRRNKVREARSSNGVTYAVTDFNYDAVGRLICTAVRMDPAQWAGQTDACAPQSSGPSGPDRITKNVYDAAGQLVQIRQAVGTPLEQAHATYSYTSNGRQEYVVDAAGNRAKLEYDGFDRRAKWIFPSTAKASTYYPSTQPNALATAGTLNTNDYEQYGYDANGNRNSLRKRDGQTITYSYDSLNRMTLKNLPSGSDVYYGYDLRGLQTYARFNSTGGEGVTSAWDGFGRLTSSANGMGGTSRTLGYQYDANGNRTRLTFPDGQYLTYEYDGLDRMVRIRENGGTEIASFSYNNKGERVGIGGGFNSGFSYDGISRLAGITHDMAGTGQDVTFCMGTLSGETCNPAYNAASQLLNRSISNSAYVWNGHANVNRAYTVNGLNQYMAAGSVLFAYDPNGNLTSDGSTTYAYDVENRLLTASGSTNATLSWDPMGRLYQTTGSATTRFLYDGDELVGEYDGSGALLRRYVHGSGEDDPLIWYEGAGLGDRRHLRADHQASIVAIGNSAGSSIGLNSYDQYGIPASGNIGRFAYTGQIRIPELGMYHYKARIYSPTLGRFLQTDPIGYDDQINLYAYVANDPLNQTDPSGNQAQALAPLLCTGPQAVACGAVVVGGTAVVGCIMYCGDAVKWIGSKLFNESADPLNESADPPADNVPEAPQPGTKGSDRGCIYCVGGDKTKSGKPYVGSADDIGKRAKDKSDGRDRTGAAVIGSYPKGDRGARQDAEQRGINQNGGKGELDNMRNEVAPGKWEARQIPPPRREFE